MAFDPQPHLSGESIKLRPLRWEDREGLYEVARDPLIWELHPNRDRHEREQFDCFFEEAMRSRGALVVIDSTGALIGSTRFHGYDEKASEVEIGWTFLARSHWGGRTNRENKQLMLDHAFQSVDRVVFLIAPGNLRSRRSVEKLGARRAGERADGSGQTSLIYELRRARA